MTRKFRLLPAIVTLMAVLLSLSPADGRKRSTKDVKRERQKTEQQIARTREQIKQNDKETSRQLNRLNSLKANMALTGDTIRIIRARLDSVNSQIATVNDSIAVLSARTRALKTNYAKSLQTMRTRRQGMSDLSFVFSAKSFSQAWRRLRYLREIAKSSTRQAKKIKEATARLEEARQRLDALKAVHATALARLNSTQAKMATEQKDADKLVADLRTQGKSLTRELERRREQARKLAAELDRVIEQEAREAEERARREAEERRRREEAEAAARKKAEEEAARKKAEEERKAREAEEAERKAREERQQQTAKPKPAESPKPATPKPAPKPKSEPKETKKETKKETPKPAKETKKETPKPAQKETPNQPAVPAAKPAMEAAPAKKLSGSFAQNKGRLMFPVAGRYVITSNFGTNDHPELSKVKIDNLGIDIEVAKGSSARAVFDGVVSSIFRLDGYHNIIIVRHGEYLTVYAGIERLSVKKGDKVTAGQTLGTIYSDPDDDNRTSLHFEIRHEKQKLNPTEWVK